jgi:hypothetical protein
MSEKRLKKDMLCEAVQNRQKIRFMYKGHPRVVEPHLLGLKQNGRLVLSAWFVRGYTKSRHEPPWRSYSLSDIRFLEILDESFIATRPGYNRNDSTMKQIVCRI